MDNKSEWLANLKPGDQVIVHWSHYDQYSIANVERITPTQIVISNTKFRRSNGWRIGGNEWATTYIQEPTQDLLEKAETIRLQKSMAGVKWSAVPLAQLRTIQGILKANK